MKRSIALCVAAAAAFLAVPAVADAKPVHGTVLSLDRHHHKARLILAGHNVRKYRIQGGLGRKVRVGSVVSANLHGHTLRHVRSVGHSRVLKFYGRVVKSGRRGLVLRLGDGERLTLGGKKHGHARAVSAASSSPIPITISGLQPGQTVLVTITIDVSAGTVQAVSIQILPSQGSSGDSSGDSNGGSSGDSNGDGSGSGDVVDNGDGGTIDDNNGNDYTADGTVTAVDPQAGTLEVDTTDGGHLTFTADSDTLDGISVGDNVEVYYSKDTSTGELFADDVCQMDNSSGDNSSGDNSSGDNSSGDSSSGDTSSGDTSGDSSGDSSSGDTSGSGDTSDASGTPSTITIELILQFG